jgi:hypothetical protein
MQGITSFEALEAGLLPALLPLLELDSSTSSTSSSSSSSSTDAHKAAFVRIYGTTTSNGASPSGESPLATSDAMSALVQLVQGVLAAETLQLGVSSSSSGSGDGGSSRGGAHSAALALHTLHTAVTVQLRPAATAACSVRRQKVRH